MKPSISHIAALLLVVLLTACAGDAPSGSSSDSENEDVKVEKSTENEESGAQELEAERINQMRDSVEQVKMAISPFLAEGCCSEEGRQGETCCCEAVYEKYQSMLEKENSEAVEIGMTDPILARCRKLMPKQFDQLENPPSEEPDELDDLFN
ncbi:MAG TPA: hypothetical protein VJ949_13405 [Cryomorphaceae bacterium]|nr:hypothetical protein [Cryomorphaceae bacterium]